MKLRGRPDASGAAAPPPGRSTIGGLLFPAATATHFVGRANVTFILPELSSDFRLTPSLFILHPLNGGPLGMQRRPCLFAN
jgi:hypothetical protein